MTPTRHRIENLLDSLAELMNEYEELEASTPVADQGRLALVYRKRSARMVAELIGVEHAEAINPGPPPIAGMWVVDSYAELTREIVDAAKDLLESAAAEGKQVVVLDGIEFRWRPTRIDCQPLNVDLLRRALLHSERGDDASARAQAEVVAAEYARLVSNPGPHPKEAVA